MFYNPSQCLKNSFFDLKGVVKVRPPQGYKSTGPLLSGWSYRRPVTVTEQSGSDLTNYQVLIELDATNFDFTKTQTNGEDIRFTTDDAETLIDHWIESWDSVGETAKVWVEVPSLASLADTTIYMYYGRSSALDASNGDATFEFFDDFDGAELNINKWSVTTETAGYYSVSNSYLYINLKTNVGNNKALTIVQNILYPYTNINNYIFEARINANGETYAAEGWVLSGMGVGNENSSGYNWDYKFITGWEGYYDRYALHSWIGSMQSIALSDVYNNTWYNYYLHVASSSDATGCIGSSCANSNWNIGFSENYEFVVGGQGNAYVEYWIDHVHVRKYTSPEPSITIGSEETS